MSMSSAWYKSCRNHFVFEASQPIFLYCQSWPTWKLAMQALTVWLMCLMIMKKSRSRYTTCICVKAHIIFCTIQNWFFALIISFIIKEMSTFFRYFFFFGIIDCNCNQEKQNLIKVFNFCHGESFQLQAKRNPNTYFLIDQE